MSDEQLNDESAIQYEAVCENCGHTVDLPKGNKYYRGKCPLCSGVMSVEVEKVANMRYVCLGCGFERRASYDFDMISTCPRCSDTLQVLDCCEAK